MLRLVLILPAAVALAACQPQVPDSARGVGFESYADYMKRRDAELAAGTGQPLVPGPVISPEQVAVSPLSGVQAPQPVAVATVAPVQPAPTPRGAAVPAGIAPQAGETARTRISDEQEFTAVAARESIESDAERLRRQREQYVVVQPTAVPQRSGDLGPNIVAYALETSHQPGTKVYSRSSIRLRSYESACAPFSSSDKAQMEFLRRGGPQRDPMGVDPDGDGFACGWDPRPFRLVRQ